MPLETVLSVELNRQDKNKPGSPGTTAATRETRISLTPPTENSIRHQNRHLITRLDLAGEKRIATIKQGQHEHAHVAAQDGDDHKGRDGERHHDTRVSQRRQAAVSLQSHLIETVDAHPMDCRPDGGNPEAVILKQEISK
jgi:hypothetical protein